MKVIAVRFKSGGKSYFFDPGDIELVKDDYCIVETVKGIEYAQVVSDIRDVDDARITVPLRKVLRKATDADTKQVADNADKEKNAYRIAQEKILEHGLDMKLTDVEYAFDNSKIVFFFVAEQRVDFRDLVKDLAGIFRTRIELRQIGVREGASEASDHAEDPFAARNSSAISFPYPSRWRRNRTFHSTPPR